MYIVWYQQYGDMHMVEAVNGEHAFSILEAYVISSERIWIEWRIRK
jgi:hypothetical protein